ncbi:hypothetical protein FS749_008635 [Ceratobasidium sp. UAMH 11750]|nr:hypothetical protein FS749_008635 [Ceratobasidium sp. UAMH 11750]
MWEALKAGGFALPIPIPIEPAETVASAAAPIPRSQPIAGSSNVQTPSAVSKPRCPAGKAPKTQTKTSKPRNSTQTPALDTWWRGYSGERNYEVRHSNMDDLRRILTGQVGRQAHEEHTRPAKRPRFDNMDNSRQAPLELSSTSHTPSPLPSTPHIANSTLHAPARPVGQLIVPSQRPRPPPLQPRPPVTAVGLTRLLYAEAVTPLRHPSPLVAGDFTYFGIPRIHAFHPRTAPLYRPPNPQPPPWRPSLDHCRAIGELRTLLNPLSVRLYSLDP